MLKPRLLLPATNVGLSPIILWTVLRDSFVPLTAHTTSSFVPKTSTVSPYDFIRHAQGRVAKLIRLIVSDFSPMTDLNSKSIPALPGKTATVESAFPYFLHSSK